MSVEDVVKYSPTSLSLSMESWPSSSSRWPMDKNCQLRASDSCCQVSGGGSENSDKFCRTSHTTFKSLFWRMTGAIQINISSWHSFAVKRKVALPSIHLWRTRSTTWWRPRHWTTDWYWKWQPQAGNWPTSTPEETSDYTFWSHFFSNLKGKLRFFKS